MLVFAHRASVDRIGGNRFRRVARRQPRANRGSQRRRLSIDHSEQSLIRTALGRRTSFGYTMYSIGCLPATGASVVFKNTYATEGSLFYSAGEISGLGLRRGTAKKIAGYVRTRRTRIGNRRLPPW